MSRKQQRKEGIDVARCSICEDFKITVGQQWLGGVRYCKDCIRHTLAWVQLSEDERTKLLATMDAAALLLAVKRKLDQAAQLTPEQKKANSIGEARRRMHEAERW